MERASCRRVLEHVLPDRRIIVEQPNEVVAFADGDLYPRESETGLAALRLDTD
jgi:hypothetical protein